MGLAPGCCSGGGGGPPESESESGVSPILNFLWCSLQIPRLPVGLLSTGSEEVREEICLLHWFVFLPLYLCHHINRKEHVVKLWVSRILDSAAKCICQARVLLWPCPHPQQSPRRSALSSFPSWSPRHSEAVAGTSPHPGQPGLSAKTLRGRELSLPGPGDVAFFPPRLPPALSLSAGS